MNCGYWAAHIDENYSLSSGRVDGLVERFNRTLLMMLAMFAGEHKDDWDDLLPPVMMAYRSSVHESTGFSPYRLMLPIGRLACRRWEC